MITLSASRRRRFFEDLLAFQLDELNGLGDRIRFLRGMAQRDDEKVANAWARCEKVVEAVSWSRAEAKTCVTRRLRLALGRPEDAFGLFVLAERVGCGRALIRRWWMALTPSARRAVVQSGLLFVHASNTAGVSPARKPSRPSRPGTVAARAVASLRVSRA